MKTNGSEKVIDNLTLLCSQGQEISSIDDLDTLIERMLDISNQICEAGGSLVAMNEKNGLELFFKASTGKNSGKTKKFRTDRTAGVAGDVIESKEPVIVNDISDNPGHYGFADKETGVFTRNLIGVPIIWKESVLGVIVAVNKKRRMKFTEQDREYLNILANQAGASVHITRMVDHLQNFFINILEIMMLAGETLSSSQGHTLRVARLATKIARQMGISGEEYSRIYYASLIHDIGQIKAAREQIVGGDRLIPTLGADTIRPIRMLKGIPEIVESFREKYDGSGFPKGLKGDEIPLAARIIGLAKDYEEMREEEAYRKQFDPYFQDDFFRRIMKSHDPEVVSAFKEVRRREREKQSTLQAV